MNQAIRLLIISCIMHFNPINAQTLKQEFNALYSKKDTLAQRQLLEKWEKSNSNDPELFVAYFNYYVGMSKKEIVTLGNQPQGKDVLKIMDQDSTVKEPVGYIYGSTYYDPTMLSKGFSWINKGIEKYPSRLDMRFGKIYMFGQIQDYENFTVQIIKAIDYSNEIKNQWTWAEGKPLDDPKEFMLGSIQTYQLQLYNTENDSLLNNMKRIAESVLKYYPDHVESLSNLSIVYMLQKQYDKALMVLLKAEKINPSDYIVLGNIAQAYKLKSDYKNAIKYYELNLKYGDARAKNYAKQQIEELKSKQ